ncbi:hypothetical protein EV363DRAFT_747680 [Boletus edulis]|nr:hypothetical protein EV363DRAFT_747680 [Boletus edulis]
MSIQEPAWLKRTRPCPFFSQGRCLFADSCNFLHDVKVRNAAHQPLLSIVQVKQPFLSPKPVFDPPSVVVNSASPRSVHLASPQNPANSTQDSSRYSGLLSVLSDVIGPPSDPPTTAEDAVPASRVTTTIPTGTATEMGTGQGASLYAEQFLDSCTRLRNYCG